MTFPEYSPAFLPNQLYVISMNVSEDQNVEHPSTSTSEVYVSEEQCDQEPAEMDTTVSLTRTSPQIALELFESGLSAEQLSCYKFCYGKYDITTDSNYMTWKQLKLLRE